MARVLAMGILAAVALFAAAMAQGDVFKKDPYQVKYAMGIDSFDAWMRDFGKAYRDEIEYTKRKKVFYENMRSIVSHNTFEDSFKLAINEMADLTLKEFQALKGLRAHEPQRPYRPRESVASDLPDSIDWRDANVVTPVKDQKQCGSCWAFSTTGSTEAAYAIKTGQLISLSEQELVDCSSGEGDQGCSGGLMDYAFQFIIDNNGICTEAEYPYTASNDECRSSSCSSNVSIKSFVDVIANNETDLKAALARQPVSVAVDASSLTWQFYHSGVMKRVFLIGCGTSLDHGVLAVGYGVDKGIPYWLVKNSWGPTWGESGYIRIKRHDATNSRGTCGIAMKASYPIV